MVVRREHLGAAGESEVADGVAATIFRRSQSFRWIQRRAGGMKRHYFSICSTGWLSSRDADEDVGCSEFAMTRGRGSGQPRDRLRVQDDSIAGCCDGIRNGPHRVGAHGPQKKCVFHNSGWKKQQTPVAGVTLSRTTGVNQTVFSLFGRVRTGPSVAARVHLPKGHTRVTYACKLTLERAWVS